jgi:hypothetical protein
MDSRWLPEDASRRRIRPCGLADRPLDVYHILVFMDSSHYGNYRLLTRFRDYSSIFWMQAILLNRIQHVVVPTHDRQTGRLNSWLSKLLPIDTSATQTRFLLRSASLYLLWKSLLLMGAILLQAFDMFPDISLLEGLRQRAAMVNMVDVCWSSFVAVCVAMAIDTFTRGLDGGYVY